MFQTKIGVRSIIFEALFELIIFQTAKADIPGCHFLETVNITSSPRLQNGSYIYQNLELPENLTGEYDYITTENDYYETTDSHLRGCICHMKPCIWICCRFKDWDESNGKCTDGLMEKLSEINPFLNVTLSSGYVEERNLLKDFIVLRDQMRFSDFWEEDTYTLFENGSILLSFTPTIYFRGYDCLHPNQFTSGNTEFFVAALHDSFYYKDLRFALTGQTILVCVSDIFLVLTTAVYLFVKKLQNLHGKCFICYMIATIMCFNYQLLLKVQIPLQLCALQGYSIVFFWYAKFSWLLAMSHQIWRGLTTVNRTEFEYSFGAYSTFAWGLPSILTGITFLIDLIWESDPTKEKWVTGIGWQECFYKVSLASIVYILLPLGVLVAFNTTLFILTVINVIKVKLSLKHFSDQDERAKNLNLRMQTFKVIVRLVILMDLLWTVQILGLIHDWQFLMNICNYLHTSIGIIIFLIFVLKRRTLKLIMESIRNRNS